LSAGRVSQRIEDLIQLRRLKVYHMVE
jgi:hypothetical protein